jgi:hypothetical protein
MSTITIPPIAYISMLFLWHHRFELLSHFITTNTKCLCSINQVIWLQLSLNDRILIQFVSVYVKDVIFNTVFANIQWFWMWNVKLYFIRKFWRVNYYSLNIVGLITPLRPTCKIDFASTLVGLHDTVKPDRKQHTINWGSLISPESNRLSYWINQKGGREVQKVGWGPLWVSNKSQQIKIQRWYSCENSPANSPVTALSTWRTECCLYEYSVTAAGTDRCRHA